MCSGFGTMQPRVDLGCGANFGDAPCALSVLPGFESVQRCCNHDLGVCGSGDAFCKCENCVDVGCIKTFITETQDRLLANNYDENVIGICMHFKKYY